MEKNLRKLNYYNSEKEEYETRVEIDEENKDGKRKISRFFFYSKGELYGETEIKAMVNDDLDFLDEEELRALSAIYYHIKDMKKDNNIVIDDSDYDRVLKKIETLYWIEESKIKKGKYEETLLAEFKYEHTSLYEETMSEYLTHRIKLLKIIKEEIEALAERARGEERRIIESMKSDGYSYEEASSIATEIVVNDIVTALNNNEKIKEVIKNIEEALTDNLLF